MSSSRALRCGPSSPAWWSRARAWEVFGGRGVEPFTVDLVSVGVGYSSADELEMGNEEIERAGRCF